MSQPQRTVLLIDDSPEDQEFYRRSFLQDQEYEYTILEAKSGQAGLEQWQCAQPDAVILDYRMPDMDGLEVLAVFQDRMHRSFLPVVMVTGQGDEAIAVQAMKAGAQDYLVKGQLTAAGLRLAVNTAIESVALRTQLQQSLEREHLVAQISQRIYQSLNLHEILQTTVSEVRQLLQSDRVLIFQVQTEGQGTVVAESVGSNWTPLLSTTHYDPCLTDAHLQPYRQGLAVSRPDIYEGNTELCYIELLAHLQVRANLVVPIALDGLWGMLIVHQCAAPRQWQPFEIDLLKQLTIHVGIAIQQAELHEQAQQELAERTQAEETLRQAHNELEMRVAERTAELVQANALLQQSEQRYRTLTEAIPNMIWVADAEGFSYDFNEQCQKYLRMTFEEIRGYGWVEAVHPDDRVVALTKWQKSLQTSTPFDAEYRLRRVDGVYRWHVVRGLPVYDGQKVALWIGSCTDIDDLKQMEAVRRKFSKELEIRVQERTQQLQESEERFRSAFDNAVAGIALVALDGRWLKVNPALCQLLGYSEEELLRLGSQSLTHKDDLDQLHHTIRRFLSGEISSSQMEERFLHRQGHSIWVISGMSLVQDEQGQPLYFVKQIQDISERRAMEQMKSEFISVVSHELRTPLASIRGSLGLLASGVLDDEPHTAKQMLSIATHEAERLVRLVNDILDLERFEASKVVLDKQWCDAATLMQQVAEVIKPLAEESKITVSLLPQSHSVPVWAAPDRLVQVLINLLSNAIKFSSRESTVTLTAQNQIDRVLFQVKDQGRGIPADKVETIFGQFQQVDASDARDKGGTGLGLTICRNIVQKHGGYIWVESALGKGSTFYFTLPIPLE